MDEIEAMKVIDSSLAKLDGNAVRRVLMWVNQKYDAVPVVGRGPDISQKDVRPERRENSKLENVKKPKSKSKSIAKIDKSLNLSPRNGDAAPEFCSNKRPTSMKEKCVAAVYYMRNMLELEAVGIDQVYTFFKFVGWPVPSDLPNMLAQAGSAGWLDTSSLDAIKLTHMGENLIEFKLPKIKKEK